MITPEELSVHRRERDMIEREMIRREMERRRLLGSFKAFVIEAWRVVEPSVPFVDGPHIDAICMHLEAVFKGEIRELLINIPPRHAKSTLVSVMYPAWVWAKRPNHKFIYTSYADNLSKRDSVKCRSLVTSEWFNRTFKIQWGLRDDQNEKEKFENTMGGFRYAASIGGAIIGEGGDTLVVDDPHSPKSVKSELKRQNVMDWFDEELSVRVNDPKTTSKIVIMQRLHEDDLSGHIIKKGSFVHLCLPAEFEEDRKCETIIGWQDTRETEGEPLWPARFGYAEIAELKKMGAMAWAGQGQQRPAPADGTIFKRSWLGNFYLTDPKELATTMDFLALSIDLPFDEGGSYAVYQVWGRKSAKRYLLDQTRARVGFNEQQTMFKSIVAKWPNLHAKWIEKKANGAAIISTMKKMHDSIIPITPTGSKEVRAEAISPQFEAGDVFLPDPSIAPWINDYIEELVVFNNGSFNDQVDATSQALMRLQTAAPSDWTPISIIGASKWNR